MKLLYYSPSSYGGLADYAHEQANALANLGIEVTFMCTPNYPKNRGELYQTLPVLQDDLNQKQSNKVIKVVRHINTTVSNYQTLAKTITTQDFNAVLLGSYAEYFAPIWAGNLKKLAQAGVVFGAIVHDPVRDFVLGPPWWHRWSIAAAYSFLTHAFVHEPIELDTGRFTPQLQTTVIPHGIYQFPQATLSQQSAREALGIPPDARVMLAFGHIRDGKNLDLVLQAMAQFSDLYLLVAGKEQSSGQRPVICYQKLAEKLNVAERCRWHVRFIPEREVGNFFVASDLVLLTYSEAFRSASGVLNATVNYRKPCLASSGESVLKSVVEKYQLGIWVFPDSVEAIVNGLNRWMNADFHSKWDQYIAENSWPLNAKLVLSKFNQLPIKE
ncbi:MAG: glycosyltransferase [Oscillatoriales cyanobacterium RM2_1_1]|nr:glycosyltransferase [Oscillatoriales cyanobacterium SM2_3_0]NJO46151.1 glycosyltransferase [Oscillatoriales cyanobacterium RM2_1_1]